MPIQSQFSLSLELTRLIPLSLQAAGKTYDAAMKLARDLRVRKNLLNRVKLLNNAGRLELRIRHRRGRRYCGII